MLLVMLCVPVNIHVSTQKVVIGKHFLQHKVDTKTQFNLEKIYLNSYLLMFPDIHLITDGL